jgi:sugar phosphate permease
VNLFFPGWWVVLGSGVGVAFGSGVFFAQGFALLSQAIGAQFGWTQADLAKAATIFLLLQTAMYPVCGRLLDRWGSRKFAVGSIAVFALSLVVLSQIANSLLQFYLAFVLIGLVSAGTNVISYARAITHWFDRKRGMALGLAASFQAVGSFTIPVVMQKIIAQHGWSSAVLAIAALETLVCLPLVALLVKDSPAPYGLLPDGDRKSAIRNAPREKLDAGDLSQRDIFGSRAFWMLCAAFGIVGLSFYAVQPNLAFILTKNAGLSLTQIATIQGLGGIATFVGRLGFGLLLDRLHAPIVGLVSTLLVAVSFVLYATGSSQAAIVVGAVVGGLAIGGELDLAPYLAGRYFGQAAVSKVFGWLLCAFFVGAAIGPVAFVAASDLLRGVAAPLYLLAALQVIPAALLLSLGPYRPRGRNLKADAALPKAVLR